MSCVYPPPHTLHWKCTQTIMRLQKSAEHLTPENSKVSTCNIKFETTWFWDHHPLVKSCECTGGGDTPFKTVIYMGLILSSVWYFCLYGVQFYCTSSRRDLVCLGCSFRYWFLAASRLVARFARVRALRARCGPFGPAPARGVCVLEVACL